MADLNLIKRFSADSGFLVRYQSLAREVVIPYQEKARNDEIEGAEKSRCIENFRMAAEKLRTGNCDGEFYGMVFQDSDVAKWLEAAAYSLAIHPDPALEQRCDAVIALISSAQHPDGYLNTYFTVKSPERRWTNLCEAHELYCAGHLIEAAVAYAECTGKTEFLAVMCRMADHIYERFITNGTPGYPGHPEIELALMRLYRCTNEEKYKELALHFINVRGVDTEYYIREREICGWTVWGNNPHDREYMQCHRPVREQDAATGHAVRAAYLYTGMADAAYTTNDKTLRNACKRLWKNITQKQMYITGGIGSAYEGEAFTKNYHLPNDTAYSETCASIALIFFARQLLRLEKNGEYGDVMERALYNCVLASMQLDGTKFLYVNPLEILPGISGVAKTHPHTLPQRPKWFACACCPPNAARLLTSIAEYAWMIEERTVYSNLFISGTLDLCDLFGGTITLQTGYPYENTLRYCFDADMELTLAVRTPDWSIQTELLLNGKPVEYEIRNGFAYIHTAFAKNDVLSVTLDFSVKRIYSNANVSADSGKTAIQRGPLVYCAEGADNDGSVLDLRIRQSGQITAQPYSPDLLHGIVPLTAAGERMMNTDALYTYTAPEWIPCEITLIPYYAWGNRDLHQMRVWIPETK